MSNVGVRANGYLPNVGVGGSLVLKTAGFLDGMIRKSIGFVLTSVFVRGILLLKLAKANYIKTGYEKSRG